MAKITLNLSCRAFGVIIYATEQIHFMFINWFFFCFGTEIKVTETKIELKKTVNYKNYLRKSLSLSLCCRFSIFLISRLVKSKNNAIISSGWMFSNDFTQGQYCPLVSVQHQRFKAALGAHEDEWQIIIQCYFWEVGQKGLSCEELHSHWQKLTQAVIYTS